MDLARLEDKKDDIDYISRYLARKVAKKRRKGRKRWDSLKKNKIMHEKSLNI